MKPAHLLAASAVASLLHATAVFSATLAAGDRLNIEQGVWEEYNYAYVQSGSYFGLDTSGNGKISGSEQNPIGPGYSGGLVIGLTTTPGASHTGSPTAGDGNAITAPWYFFGNTGSDYLVTPVTGSTEAGLNFSGWRSTWKGDTTFDWSGGAWGAGFADGIANFTWDGVYGHSYTLRYHATVPSGDPSGFGNVRYELFLTGTVKAVPEAETWALMLAGLGLVGAVTVCRRGRLPT